MYGVGISALVAYETNRDMIQLEKAVQSGLVHAENRHRINVAAEGNWFLMANIIAISGIFGLCKKW